MIDCTEIKDETYVLPVWKINQIIVNTIGFLSQEGYYKEGFDYKNIISKKGIVIKAYSDFNQKNLNELQKVSLSLWNDGLCLIFPDSKSHKTCYMIAYNDNKTPAEIMQIIFHEYAHIFFKHTEQSLNAEAEAILFSSIATFLMIAEQKLHICSFINSQGGTDNFLEGIKEGLMEKFITKEVS